jgi:sugar O-acyltransferase (sialic acid O-acetyltransferase NeuD family)
MKVIILGAGGHGKVVADCCLAAGHCVSGFLDDDDSKQSALGLPVLGTLAEADQFRESCDGLALGIGDNRSRESVFKQFKESGWQFPPVIHPFSWISPRVEIQEGAVVVGGVVINADSVIGAGAVINTGARVDHDCVVGAFAHVCPGTVLAGNVEIGTGAFIGAGSSIIPGIRIGNYAVIGVGAAVISDVADGVKVAGVPAKELD